MIPVQDFLDLLLSQDGDKYVFGAEAKKSDANPSAFDCSELIEWAAARLGVTPTVPDAASAQFRHCKRYPQYGGKIIPVAQALVTPGALLGKFRADEDPLAGPPPSGQGHIAVSQGNGETIEARSTYYGVGQFSAYARAWSIGALLPGIDYNKPEEQEDEEIMLTKSLDEAGWRALAKAGIARGGEAAVVQYWWTERAQRTDAEHADASRNIAAEVAVRVAKGSGLSGATFTAKVI